MGVALAAIAGAASAAPADGDFPPGSTCFASTSLDVRYVQVAHDPGAWLCDATRASITSPRAFVRFDMAGRPPIADPVLTTRLTLFSAMRITAIGIHGTSKTLAYHRDDMIFATNDWLMRAALPPLPEPVAAYVVEVDLPRHLGLITDAEIGPRPAVVEVGRSELVIAWLCGLLCVPLVLNFAFYRVLRQSFVLWHAAAVFCMLVQTVVTSGLINRFFTPSMMELSLLSAGSWGLAITTASLFISEVIEPGKLDRLQVLCLRWLGPWIIAWSYIYLFAPDPLRAYSAPAYLASYLPALLVFGWCMATAWHRRSRAILYQIVAWSPMMLIGTLRIVSSLGVFEIPVEFMLEQHISIGFEVIVTSLGVAERFMAIKRQRDQALANTKVLAGLAERDPLTSLYNRRGIEERFDSLLREGFDTMAVLDLDHFKRINDTMGHATGDAVLRSVAAALAPDEDALAVRIGGEEFLMLLRGRDAAQRAERRRTSIPGRIAADVPGLGQIVTASMGLITFDVALPFTQLYSRCDALLYAAKAAGRNRTESTVMAAPARMAPEGGAAIIQLR